MVKHENVSYFQFPALRQFPELMHAIGCRRGGQSRPPFDGMNLGKDVGDDPESVTANRNLWRQVTGGGHHVYATQNHGTAIRVIPSEQWHPREKIVTIPQPADALITRMPRVFLSIQTADCQSVLLYDPDSAVVANVHCGWRGSVAGLIGRVVARMRDQFGCRPDQMVAAIGPSLGPCCAEFVHYESEIPEAFWPFRIGANHFDFWRISRWQLVSAGLTDDRIYQANICTRCNSHLFFSYRAEKRTGRFASLIGLKTDRPKYDEHANGRISDGFVKSSRSRLASP